MVSTLAPPPLAPAPIPTPTGEPGRPSPAPRPRVPAWRRLVTPSIGAVVLGLIVWFGWANWAAINPAGWLGRLHWGWALLALVASAGTLAGNAFNLMGSAPLRLRFGRTMAVQSTGTVARLVSPASVGGSAVNVVYLRRLGVRTPAAVSAVGISHVVQFVSTTVLLLVVLLWLGNAPVHTGLPSGRYAAMAALMLPAAAAVAVLILRRVPSVGARVVALLGEVRQSLATLLLHPRRAALGFGGAVLISGALTVSLWAAAHAFGAQLGLGSALLILLLGSTAGGLIPVPGGIGAIDACLVAALTASGLGLAVAVPTVALFRLVTLWLHLPVGLAAGAVLRRRGWL